MTTAAELITNSLRLFGIVDQTEDASDADISSGVPVLNDLLRSQQADGAAQFLMRTVTVTLPPGVRGSVYTFVVGSGQTVDVDAVGIKAIWMNDINLTVNRETRQAPKTDVVRTTYPGIITKWHQERQADGSILVTAWQPPNRASQALIEYGGRIAAITAGDSVLELPPEGIHDATLLFGRRVCGGYGRPLGSLDPVLAQDCERVNRAWRDWARGQQWLRFLRY